MACCTSRTVRLWLIGFIGIGCFCDAPPREMAECKRAIWNGMWLLCTVVDVALHVITSAVGAEGRRYLEREAWRARVPVESEEVSNDAADGAEAISDVLSVGSLNVDSLGHYAASLETCIDASLTGVFCVEPDVCAFQEVIHPMFVQIKHRLPEWSVNRRNGDCLATYSNVTALSRGSDETTTFPFLRPRMGATSSRRAEAAGTSELRVLSGARDSQSETRGRVSFIT